MEGECVECSGCRWFQADRNVEAFKYCHESETQSETQTTTFLASMVRTTRSTAAAAAAAVSAAAPAPVAAAGPSSAGSSGSSGTAVAPIIVLAEAKSNKAKQLRARITGFFYNDHLEKFDAPPTQEEIDRHIWNQELAALVPYESEFLHKTIYATVFGLPLCKPAEHLAYVTECLGVTNPAHQDQIADQIADALNVRAEIFHLFGGGYGNNPKEIRNWMGDLVERYTDPLLGPSLDNEEQQELGQGLIDEILLRMGMAI